MTDLDHATLEAEGDTLAIETFMCHACGSWANGWKGDRLQLDQPGGRATGELQRFGDHYSLSLDGLSPGQVETVMRALRREDRE